MSLMFYRLQFADTSLSFNGSNVSLDLDPEALLTVSRQWE